MLRRAVKTMFTNVVEGQLRWRYKSKLTDALRDVRSVAALHGSLDATSGPSQLNEALLANGYRNAYGRVHVVGAKAGISRDELNKRISEAADRGYSFGHGNPHEGKPLR